MNTIWIFLASLGLLHQAFLLGESRRNSTLSHCWRFVYYPLSSVLHPNYRLDETVSSSSFQDWIVYSLMAFESFSFILAIRVNFLHFATEPESHLLALSLLWQFFLLLMCVILFIYLLYLLPLLLLCHLYVTHQFRSHTWGFRKCKDNSKWQFISLWKIHGSSVWF